MATNPYTPQSNGASDGLDYARSMIDEVGTGLESSFEAITSTGVADGAGVVLAEVGAGVTADLVGIEPLAFATAMMLAMYVSGWLLTMVAKVLPNPSILGWHPAQFLITAIDDLGKEWEHAALDVIDHVKHWLMQPIRQIIGMFQRLGNATGAAHNKAAHIVNNVIPLSVNDGIARAEWFATQQIYGIKTQLAGAVTRLTGHVTEAQAKSYITDAAKYGGIGWDITAIAAGAIVAADEFATTVGNDAAANLRKATAKVATDAQAALNDLHHQLITQLTGDENVLSSLTNTVKVTIPASVAAQVATAQATDAKNLADSTNRLQSEIDTINGEIDTLKRRITGDEQIIAQATANITTLESAQTVDTQAISTERQLIITAQSDILSNITGISDLSKRITGISDTLAPIQVAQKLNTTQLSPFEGIGAIALPTALATISATLNTLKTKVDTCTVDTCDPAAPNNIRNVLRDLLGVMTAAGEIGFIAEAIKNPEGTANAIAPLLGGIDTGATSALDTLLSLL